MEPESEPNPDASRSRLRTLERERGAIEQRLFHLERLSEAGLLAGGLVHDMRNVFAAISGTCQIAMLDPDRAAVDALDKVHRLALQAAESMKVFLTFVRRGSDPRSSCDVEDAVSDAQRFLQPVLKKSAAKILSNVPRGLVVGCERSLLLQVLVNLLQNAARAVEPTGGRVEVTAHPIGDEVVLDVSDDGPGVPEGVRARLFEPFATGHAQAGGTGLGLFVARRIVEEAGGRIELVVGERPGATFRVALPIAQTRALVPVGQSAKEIRR